MEIKKEINFLNSYKKGFKVILFLVVFLFLPSTFKLLDATFKHYIPLSTYINVFDFIFFNFLAFCLIKKNQLKDFLSFPTILFLSYIFLCRLSLFLSDPEVHYKAYFELFKSFSYVFIFLAFTSDLFKKNYEKILKTFFVLFFSFTLFESILAILQFFLQRPLGFWILKEPHFGLDIQTSATIYISEGSQFLSKFFHFQTNNLLRAHGTFIHPNVLGGFLNISLILTFFLIYQTKKKILFSFFLMFQLIALILTFSRAALCGFVISSFLFFLLMVFKNYKVKKMFFIYLTFFLMIIGSFSRYLLERGFLGSLFQSNNAKEMNIGSHNTRKTLQNASINMIKKHPFFGVGFRNFLIRRLDYSNQNLERAHVHNIYLLIASETGIVTLLVFLAFLGYILIHIFRYFLDPLNIAIFSCIISFLMIGFFDHYPISSDFGKMILFTFLGYFNFIIKVNQPFSCTQRVYLCQ